MVLGSKGLPVFFGRHVDKCSERATLCKRYFENFLEGVQWALEWP